MSWLPTNNTKEPRFLVSKRNLSMNNPKFHLYTDSDVQLVMSTLGEYGITPTELKSRLEAAPMTVNNIQLFLNQCTTEQLSRFFYTSGLAKLAEIAVKVNENQQQATKPSESTAV